MSNVSFTEEEDKFREVREFAKKETEPFAQDMEKKDGYGLIRKSLRKIGNEVSSGFCTPKMLGVLLGD